MAWWKWAGFSPRLNRTGSIRQLGRALAVNVRGSGKEARGDAREAWWLQGADGLWFWVGNGDDGVDPMGVLA
ncbi:hypothetical protein V6N13_063711 [Hibiscus sabdariffa]